MSLLRRIRLLRRRRLNPLLHRLEMRKLVRILTQTPRHNTTKLLGLDDVLELKRNRLRRVPRPEDVVVSVPVVLPAGLLVQRAVFLRAAP